MGSIKIYIITFIIGLSIGIAIGWGLLESGTKKTSIKWKFGQNELDINLEQDLINSTTFLEKLFSEDFSKNGALAWLKANQKLYHFTDPHIVDEYRELDENDIVSSRLRELSISRKGPWSYQWDTVLISIPAKEFQPRPGFANVCESGKFLRNDLEVYNIDQTHSIKVTATGKYACPEGLKHPDIQLNVEDAIKLLGSSNFSKYETGIALISN